MTTRIEQVETENERLRARIAALEAQLAAALARAEEAERQLAAIEDARCRHGWKGSKPESTSRIETPCPACGLKSLFIAAGNHLTCANLSCREPSPESWCAAALARAEEAEREKDELLLAVSALMKAFDDGVFVRDTSNDNRPDWAIRLFNPLRALAVLREASDAALRQAMGVRGDE